MNKIFINIAAYRDPELIPTVRDIIKKAQKKERLSIGICWQFKDDEPEDMNEEEDVLFDGVKLRYIRMPYKESRGMNWARKLAHGFYTKDCNYYLQIDSHMRFVKDWDYELLKMVAKCDSDNPVISQRCFPYYPEKNSEFKNIRGTTYLHGKKFRENGVLAISAGHYDSEKRKITKPLPASFISGHFMFARSSLIKQMPYDEDIAVIATGDEPLLSIKAFTRGWDIFMPHKPVAYHYFYRTDHPKAHNDLKDKDKGNHWKKLADLGVTRSNKIMYDKETGPYGLGTKRTLEEFGKFAGIDFKKRKIIEERRVKGTYKDKAYDASFRLKKSKKAKAAKSSPKSSPESDDEKIFVQIASYRDPDVEKTIKDLIRKAAKPDNLIIALCDQYGPENKHLTLYDRDNFRVIRVPFYMSSGLGWARAQLQKLYFDDAKYTMQLDSHMRFAPDWDKKLINMIKKTESPKPIISHYCPAFSTKDDKNDEFLRKKALLKMYCLRFNKTGTVSFRANHVPKEDRDDKPLRSMLVSGHFYFTLAQHIREFEYDPELYFAGDEVTLATRSWTRGWDIFNPTENVVWHNYTREERVCHWADQKMGYGKLHEESLKRLRQLLHGEDNGFSIGKYGLGEARSLEEFEELSGIDFKNRELSEKAKDGKFY
jgi:hypothetical protein